MLKNIQLQHHQHALEILAQQLLKEHQTSLPNLGELVILLPDLSASKELRRLLLDNSSSAALIPPQITTLQQWVNAQLENELTVLNNHGRILMMVEVLNQHPEAFGADNHPWSLADELLLLFDELNLSELNTDAFSSHFDDQHPVLGGFSDDARKIQILWDARELQLEQESVIDRSTLYKRNLQTLLAQSHDQQNIYTFGLDGLAPLERRLLEQCEWLNVTQIGYDTASPVDNDNLPDLTHALQQVYAVDTEAFQQRTLSIKETIATSPFNALSILAADNREQEAACIDLQIRLWILDGKQRIGVVTEDRLLARRISALLGRSALEIFDSAGWPLSTTRAAAALEHWMLCLENDFHQIHLLDFLKSSFVKTDGDPQDLLYYLEHDLIQQEKSNSGIESYLHSIKQRNKRLSLAKTPTQTALIDLLKRLRKAAKPLQDLQNKTHDAETYIKATLESLEHLGLDTSFAEDPAGRRVLQEVEDMRQGLQQRSLNIAWAEYRSWLGRALETHNFRPDLVSDGVTISNYQQASTANFDVVILAGADQKSLPRKQSRRGLFSNEVRKELGLRNWHQEKKLIFARYRRLLEAAPEVLISYTRETDQGPQLPSPWITLLQGFHQAVWQSDLSNTSLQPHITSKKGLPRSDDEFALPEKESRSVANLNSEQIPSTITASRHQSLVNCPYQFFSQKVLNIRAWDSLEPAMQKRDFGELAHSCLQQFHQQIPAIENYEEGIEQLEQISHTVFAESVQQEFINTGWWLRWTKIIPHYIKWQIEWQKHWSVGDLEASQERLLANKRTKLFGVLDRLDRREKEVAVIDYKTGASASANKIAAGEDVQLLTYGMLVDSAAELLYLKLDPNECRSSTALKHSEELVEAAENRLNEVLDLMAKGHDLPAWGDEDVCKYCDYKGLCRKGSWQFD